jgi:hypothetical protein
MFPLVETAIAFAILMLTAALFVSALVQLVQKIGRYRSQTVAGMVKSVIHGFRVYHDDSDILAAEDEKDPEKKMHRAAENERVELQFVNDILSDPVLHTRAERVKYGDDSERLAKLVEYIHGDDLTALVFNWSKYYAREASPPAEPDASRDPISTRQVASAAVDLPLPAQWVGSGKPYATTGNFAAYVGRWFATLESTATERFKKRIRALTIVISAVVIVLFNLDGAHLIRELYRNSGARTALTAQLSTLELTAGRLGVRGALQDGPEADTTNRELALELQKTASILDDADVGIGWQNSWIVARWCAYRGECRGTALPPTRGSILLDTFAWLSGLLFSCVMLSLGAPFWYGALASLLNLKNEVQKTGEQAKTDKWDDGSAAAVRGAAAPGAPPR